MGKATRLSRGTIPKGQRRGLCGMERENNNINNKGYLYSAISHDMGEHLALYNNINNKGHLYSAISHDKGEHSALQDL